MFARHGALLGNQNSPHLWMGRYGWDGTRDGSTANIPGDITPLHCHGVLATILNFGGTDYYCGVWGEACQRGAIIGIYSFPESKAGDRAGHFSSIYIEIV